VGDLPEYEAYRGVVRLPLSVMERLGIKPGDFVEVAGSMSTYAVAQPTEEEDVAKMDAVMRMNIGVELGDSVRVRRVALPPAERVVIRTSRLVDADVLKRHLLSRPLAEGDVVVLPQQGGVVTLRVEEITPAPVAYVQLSTKVEVRWPGSATGPHLACNKSVWKRLRRRSKAERLTISGYLLAGSNLAAGLGFLILFVALLEVLTAGRVYTAHIFYLGAGYFMVSVVAAVFNTAVIRNVSPLAVGLAGLLIVYVLNLVSVGVVHFLIAWYALSALIALQGRYRRSPVAVWMALASGVGLPVLVATEVADALKRLAGLHAGAWSLRVKPSTAFVIATLSSLLFVVSIAIALLLAVFASYDDALLLVLAYFPLLALEAAGARWLGRIYGGRIMERAEEHLVAVASHPLIILALQDYFPQPTIEPGILGYITYLSDKPLLMVANYFLYLATFIYLSRMYAWLGILADGKFATASKLARVAATLNAFSLLALVLLIAVKCYALAGYWSAAKRARHRRLSQAA